MTSKDTGQHRFMPCLSGILIVIFAVGTLSGCGATQKRSTMASAPQQVDPEALRWIALLDEKEILFRSKLSNTNISVVRSALNLTLILPGDTAFVSGSANINHSAKPLLSRIVQLLNRSEKMSIMVKGHTDSTGSEEDNLILSEQRAEAVKVALKKLDVQSSRINTVGMGEYKPISTNETAIGRSQNRRIEITLYNPKHMGMNY